MLFWAVPLPDIVVHLTILFLLPFLTYYESLTRGGWASDDCLGSSPGGHKPIASYEGTLQRPLTWGSLCKWVRYYLGRIPNPNPKWKEEKQPAYVASKRSHHRINLWWLGGVCGLAYLFLAHVFTPTLAFYTCLLFLVHPLGGMVSGWVSGCNYLFGAFFMLLGLNLVLLMQFGTWLSHPLLALCGFIVYGLCQWMAGESMFQMAGVIAILLWLQAWPFVLIAILVSVWQGSQTFRESIALRRKTFLEQNMGGASRFYAKKVFVAMKLLYYNVKLSVFPKRLGLYSSFLYHYPLPETEAETRHFWFGVCILTVMGVGAWLGGPVVQLSVLWFLAFVLIFSGLIVINQIVVDRYVWLPSLGTCLLVTWLCLQCHLMVGYAFLVGLALMRTWVHLPTYENEEMFYRSNIWNFPDSEVAYGNLGIAYLNQGYIGMCLDSWWKGIQLNPDYDVCWYNLATNIRGRGPQNPNYFPLFFSALPKEVQEVALNRDPQRQHLHIARYCLQKAATSKTCHFKETWQRELLGLEQELARPLGAPPVLATLVRPLLTAAVT